MAPLKPNPYQPQSVVVDKMGNATPGYRLFWNNLAQRAAATIQTYWGWRGDITDAQFKALPTTFQTIVEAPGEGLTLIPWWGYVQINAASPYTNVDPGSQAGIAIAYGDWDIDALNFMSNWVGTTIGQILTPFIGVPDAAALAAVYPGQNNCWLGENLPLKLIAWNPSGDYTGGDPGSTFRVGVAYSILNVQTGVFV